VVPLYFAAERPTIERQGSLLVLDDDRLPLQAGEQVKIERVRFRTLGCWPLTAAIRSDAADLESVIEETLSASVSERQGRLIDHDDAGGMERKKQEGYF
jgi:sulfate adenylyltransferase subunit 2